MPVRQCGMRWLAAAAVLLCICACYSYSRNAGWDLGSMSARSMSWPLAWKATGAGADSRREIRFTYTSGYSIRSFGGPASQTQQTGGAAARGQAAFFIRKTGSQQRLPHTILQCHPLPHDGAPLLVSLQALSTGMHSVHAASRQDLAEAETKSGARTGYGWRKWICGWEPTVRKQHMSCLDSRGFSTPSQE
eukprot:COSAG01_NODE_1110_length_11657_cov_5.360616_12_plen_191_part_00